MSPRPSLRRLLSARRREVYRRRPGDPPGVERQRRWTIRFRENWYRDVWLLTITGVSLLGIYLAIAAVHNQNRGRRFAIGVTCAAVSAVTEAGRQVILGSATGKETPFDRNLERLGYPPFKVRKQNARLAARLYTQHISTSIDRTVGKRGDRLVRPDGTLDCRRLQQLAVDVSQR